MSDRLSEVRAKFNWTCKHHESWQTALDHWLEKREPYTVRWEVEDPWLVIRLVERERPPFELSLIWSDFLNGLRATLDHIVCHLNQVWGGDCEHTSFPIKREPNHWPGAIREDLRRFPSLWHPEIHDAQPFMFGADYARHPAYLIHHLDIRTKHRTLMRFVVSYFEWEAEYLLNRNARQGEFPFDREPPPMKYLEDGVELRRIGVFSEQDDLRVIGITKINSIGIGIGPASDLTDYSGPIPNLLVFVGSMIEALAPAFP